MPRRTPDAARRRLTKADALTLLVTYDRDPIAALSVALRRLLERPHGTWPELVGAIEADPCRRDALVAGQLEALDELAAELNERRGLPEQS